MIRGLGILIVVWALMVGAPTRADPIRDRIYPAPEAALTLEGLPAGARLIAVETRDGLALRGVEASGRPDRPVLFVLHGNGSSAGDAVRWFAPAIEAGYGVVAVEYRGYSANPGSPSEAGLAADSDAFMAHARQMAAGRPLWIVGHSLGGGVAMPLAEREPPDVLVTIGTFTRLRDMVTGLARAVVPDAYRNIDRARSGRAPWFLIHGLADEVVPAAQGEALHAAAGRAGRRGASLAILGADHHPDGATIVRILEAIRSRAPDAPPSPDAVPETVSVIPFGQSAPLPVAGK